MVFRVMSCKQCGRDEFAVGYISSSHYCEDCGIQAAVDHVVQMKLKRGPAWDHWLSKLGAYVERERQGDGS